MLSNESLLCEFTLREKFQSSQPKRYLYIGGKNPNRYVMSNRRIILKLLRGVFGEFLGEFFLGNRCTICLEIFCKSLLFGREISNNDMKGFYKRNPSYNKRYGVPSCCVNSQSLMHLPFFPSLLSSFFPTVLTSVRQAKYLCGVKGDGCLEEKPPFFHPVCHCC